MDTAAPCPTRRLALLVTLAAALVVAAGLYAALWTPGNFGLTTTRGVGDRPVVSWIAPDSPAWATDIVPGDTIMAGAPRTTRSCGGRDTSLSSCAQAR